MLSDEEKREMLNDAACAQRRESFRRLRALQDKRKLSLEEYCAFCEEAAGLFPGQPKSNTPAPGKKYLL
ncbi:MAG: hypothetical protein HGA80_00645 [Candidatus Omnitrophica bacterium]|nr:hypothetical protein [Candidatus Omnitrophota bacterium]